MQKRAYNVNLFVNFILFTSKSFHIICYVINITFISDLFKGYAVHNINGLNVINNYLMYNVQHIKVHNSNNSLTRRNIYTFYLNLNIFINKRYTYWSLHI